MVRAGVCRRLRWDETLAICERDLEYNAMSVVFGWSLNEVGGSVHGRW